MSVKISVLMSVLNGERFLRPALDSILTQTFTDFEFIVIDNCSTDGTAAILASYSDARFVRLRNERVVSLTESLNKGLAVARGEYVARMDADDVAAPHRLARQAEFLDANPEVLVVGSHSRVIDEAGNPTGGITPPTDSNQLRHACAYCNPIAHSAAMFRRDAVQALGGYPSEYIYAQDFALWLALAETGQLGMIGEPLVDLREHAAQSSSSPVYRFSRHQEGLELFRIARQLPGMPVEARRRGRQSIAILHMLYARDLFVSRQPFSGAVQALLAIVAAPQFAMRAGLNWLSGRSVLNARSEL